MNLQDRIDRDESTLRTGKAIVQSGRFDPETFNPRNSTEQQLVDTVLAASLPENEPNEF
jgi:hypothetical protein